MAGITPVDFIRFDDEASWPRTWQERCEIIAHDMEFMNVETLEVVKWTASKVFSHHPTGELFQVNLWFIRCLVNREIKARLLGGEDPAECSRDLEDRLRKWQKSSTS